MDEKTDIEFGRTVAGHHSLSLHTDQRVLNRRFRLVERVGRGGMSEVWKAHDTQLEKIVALKSTCPCLSRS